MARCDTAWTHCNENVGEWCRVLLRFEWKWSRSFECVFARIINYVGRDTICWWCEQSWKTCCGVHCEFLNNNVILIVV